MALPEHHIEEIEHTADWAIRVRARGVPGLFVGAARGMFGLLTDLSQVAVERRFEISLRAIDVETLLVDWLNELLFLGEQEGLVFCDFDIHDLAANGEARLRAQASGGRPGELLKVIKAATFSGLAIERGADGFQVDLVFDV